MVERVLFGPGGATEAKQDDEITAIEAVEAAVVAVEAAIEPVQVTAYSAAVTTSGTTTVISPSPGNRLRLYWIGVSGNPSNSAHVQVGVRWDTGGTDFLNFYISQYGGSFSHSYKSGDSYVLGGVDEPLVVNLSAAQGIIVNVDYEEVT